MIHNDIAWPVEPGWHLGVSGSRRRYGPPGAVRYPTPDQVAKLRVLLRLAKHHGATHLHHGSCTGWDEAAVRIAALDRLGYVIIAHPPINEDHLSRWALEESNVQCKPKEYHARDFDIATWSDILFLGPAFPEYDSHSRHSGTWMTARYGRRLGVLLYAVDTQGELSDVTRHVVAGTDSTEEQ